MVKYAEWEMKNGSAQRAWQVYAFSFSAKCRIGLKNDEVY